MSTIQKASKRSRREEKLSRDRSDGSEPNWSTDRWWEPRDPPLPKDHERTGHVQDCDWAHKYNTHETICHRTRILIGDNDHRPHPMNLPKTEKAEKEQHNHKNVQSHKRGHNCTRKTETTKNTPKRTNNASPEGRQCLHLQGGNATRPACLG